MTKAYIGLGSNIEPREQYLLQAMDLIEEQGNVWIRNKSPIYETDPVDYLAQADFLNMVIGIQTSLSSVELLAYCQKVEEKLNRVREIDKGPRTIDLDILLYGDKEIETDNLTIPHSNMHTRAFVLIPLNEIASTETHPVFNLTIKELTKGLSPDEVHGVRKWEK